MLSAEQIRNIISSGEGYNAEFKVRLPNKLKELSEEICAFANAAGGVLIIGVDDHNQIKGLSMDNAKKSALQNSLNEINPHLQTELYKVELDNKELWVVEVNSGQQKPYALSGAIYVRQGANSQKLTTIDQMRDFFQQSDRIYFDEAPCPGFDLSKDLDQDYFEEFRIEAGISKAIALQQIIQNLKLTLPTDTIKNGAVLFFGKTPEAFVETATIRCVAFDGNTKTNIIDDKFFGGPLVMQYKQAMQWLKGKLNIRYEIEGGGPRKEHWEIPETALKEAIINAIGHRDYYDKGARIHIELFNDRLEISNPGGLTSAISPNEFGSKSHSRNPLIFGLLVRIRLVEQLGSGISRIKLALKDAKLPEPQFKTEGLFTVVFQRVKSRVKSRVKKQDMILELIKTDKSITAEILSIQLHLSIKSVYRYLKKLKDSGKIKREGSDKSGSWIILTDE